MVDPINNPRHYQFGQLEAWDIIELAIENTPDPVTAYHVASALKYLLRASRKGGDTDIAKACAHLKHEVARTRCAHSAVPDYDQGGVAFRHGDRVTFACAPKVGAPIPRPEFIGYVPHKAAVELADADGCMEYGNPITPGCATTPWRLP